MTTLLEPADAGQLAEAVAGAAGAGTPLEISGGGTRLGLGRPVQAGATLSTAKLSGITLYEPGALTLVAKAGTSIAKIEAALAAEGQMLPFEPMDHRSLLGTTGEPTIGGAVAVAAAGPRRIQKGACRDAMIGVRLVDGRGQQVANGGRVMKNVTGLDLVKPMAGQFGTLGVLTEIGFKLLPAPKSTVTLCLNGLSDDVAIRALSDALGGPFDVSAAAHLPHGPDGTPTTLLRLEGLEGSVAYRTTEMQRALAGHGDAVAMDDAAATWASIRDVAFFAGREGAVWRVSVKPSDGPKFVDAVRSRTGLQDAFYDWGGGLVWLLVPEDNDAGAKVLREALAVMGGHATLVRASAATRSAVDVFQPEPAPLARIAAGMRAKFDPHGILNPGRMG